MGFKQICAVNTTQLLVRLTELVWPPSGGGVYAMIKILAPEWAADQVIAQVLSFYPGGRRGMTMYSRLIPGQTIPAHIDEHEGCHKRVHVPITTNAKSWFHSGDQTSHFEVGYAYEIDPFIPHSVVNEGKIDRVHLIFNVL